MGALTVEDSTLVVVRALERMKVRHYVCGSLASSLHGEPRATNDADLVAVLSLNHFEALRNELGDRFYVDEDGFREAVVRGRSFNLVDEVDLEYLALWTKHFGVEDLLQRAMGAANAD